LSEEEKPKVQNPLESCQGPSGFIFILAAVLLVYIMFGGLGEDIAEISGTVLNPLIGFGGKFPLLTMLCAGLITISVSSIVRHFLADWVDMAKKQRIMNQYNKEVREATKANNQGRLEKLNEQQQDIMGMQSSLMMTQMKSSIISMVVAILIFRWLYSFIWSVHQPTITLPWNPTWELTGMALEDVCGSICMAPGGRAGLPYWIIVYILITIPIGQALMRGLKYFEFSRKLKSRGESIFGEILHPQEDDEEDEKEVSDKGGKKHRKRKPGKAPKLDKRGKDRKR
jgi:uncharacterized membrane protein (DUF106 family)